MCKLANCSAGKGLENFNAIWSIGINSDNRIKNNSSNNIKKYMARAALLAFLEAPSDDKTDVM